MPKTEQKLVEEMCWLIHDWEKDKLLPPENPKCKVLASALYSAKSATKPWGVISQRVFIQDFAASLNRRGLLPNEKVDEFEELGYEYMEI